MIKRFTPPHPLDIGFRIEQGLNENGRLIMVPSYYVHTLEICPASEHPRRLVDSLTDFAHGFALHARDHAPSGGFAPSEILFHVAPDNAKMRGYVESKGATAESAILYRLPL